MLYRTGDLMDVTEGVIAHGCNAQGVMRSGVAKVIREKYPLCYTKYSNDIQTGLKLGKISVYTHSASLVIVNAITQEYYGKDGKKYVSYDAVDSCFKSLFEMMKDSNAALNIPTIGAGLGGGSWNIIETIIDEAAESVGFDTDDIICWSLPTPPKSIDQLSGMDIYSPKGTKVIFLDKNGYEHHREHAKSSGMKKGDELTVSSTVVHSCSTDVYFYEYPGKYFNSVMFGAKE